MCDVAEGEKEREGEERERETNCVKLPSAVISGGASEHSLHVGSVFEHFVETKNEANAYLIETCNGGHDCRRNAALKCEKTNAGRRLRSTCEFP